MVARIGLLVDQICTRLSSSRILLLGILPREHSADAPVRREIEFINASLQKQGLPSAVSFLDVGRHILQGDGSLSIENAPDGLHLSSRGYDSLAPVISDAVTQILAELGATT